ncbi:MAG: hypothetical protein RM022_012335 [Nostoc sp. EfeVER01]|uniref:hypothetical protein n=1 Tax=Nostoc sp. EfeVER01 TaxID=3075406 RepID=UPI002AD5298E|nr:hypothetical protein [Nostoc sp. EfeVER01]MDZ7946200.1 hypothetical protein [Nostoc sp. EfeVER01]
MTPAPEQIPHHQHPRTAHAPKFEAVSDGIGREWTIEEKQFIENNSELESRLKEWLNNSLSDTCWHQTNYKIVRDLGRVIN